MKWILFSILTLSVIATFFWASNESGEKEIVTKKEGVVTIDHEFSVITYNLGYASGLLNLGFATTEETKEKANETVFEKNLKQLSEHLEAIQPDVMLLQEVDFDSDRSYNTNQAEYIANALPLPTHRYDSVNWSKRFIPYPITKPARWVKAMQSGQSILSSYPIIDYRTETLEKPKKNYFYDRFYFERLLQSVVIKVGQENIAVLNVHLDAYNEEVRERQLDEVLNSAERYRGLGMPIVLGGDFNRTFEKGGKRYEQIREIGLTPIRSEPLPTYPSDNPQQAIDHLFYTQDSLVLKEHKRLDGVKQVSDHLPLYAVFMLKE